MSNMTAMAEKNKILEYKVGSHLYGTSTPASDTDLCGVFIADEKFYLGLEKVEEVDFSIVSKRPDGKNDTDAVDKKFYELRKFIVLAKDNNPNMVSQLFTPSTLFRNDLGQVLLDNRHIFPWKGLVQRFVGYGKSQIHKAKVKPENFKDLIDAREYLGNIVERGIKIGSPVSLILGSGTPSFIKFSDTFVSIGDLKFNLQIKIGDVLESLSVRIEKASHRADGFLKNGCDFKFCMHAVRLMLEGKELLMTGELQYPLKDRDFLLDIRNGKYNLTAIIDMVEDGTRELDSLINKSTLPDKPRHDDIERLLIKMVKECHQHLV